MMSEPPRKRIKLECKPTDKLDLRNALIHWKRKKAKSILDTYNNHITELYFLKHDGNVVNFKVWSKNLPPEFMSFASQHKLLDDNVDVCHSQTSLSTNSVSPVKSEEIVSTSQMLNVNSSDIDMLSFKAESVISSENVDASDHNTDSQQEQMVEKARQEAYVVQRIASLRKEGLWSEKRMPKVQEPPRAKTHWDYLLEEMVWLSADFAQERKWKKAAAKKCARMVQRYFFDKATQSQRAEKEQEVRLRKIAAFIAKEIRVFWSNVEKLVEYKINTRLDEKKKQALDQQLSFIVDQTERYSSWLAESMTQHVDSLENSTLSSAPSLAHTLSDDEFNPSISSDDDENTIAKEEDNIDEQKSELQLLQKESEQTLEDLLNELPPGYFENRDKDTSELSAEEIDSCENATGTSSGVCNHSLALSCEVGGPLRESSRRKRKHTDSEQSELCKSDKEEDGKSDKDFEADEDDADNEETIEEQEMNESHDNEKEMEELLADSEIPIEDLRRMYATDGPMQNNTEVNDISVNDAKSHSSVGASETCTTDADSEQSDDDEEASSDSENEDAFGIESLIGSGSADETSSNLDSDKANKELEDATAVAESLQPKGYTLSSTSVTTPIPFLLKHKLREYQHVGLDWLVTMYEKKLNGILADEMGLGKTIQTIALLAHLACEKGNWGPHLIVVPTSVMLNWEMEVKKWAPAFKILTYFGSQKERKLKRHGWTKPNAFHICITSYKLVIQDHQSFRRKKWRYFILDEAQNIKNFKSQRWQLLLNFQTERRLLLTGTPLQNNLMELWSLMHFLMPHVFASHREFKEWFSNPVTGMIEGGKDYNDNIIKRLHKVLRPFILRRLKTEVEQQMPKKYEHIVMCKLSKRQRFLYEEFMSRTKTKETLASGNFLSVINILMQLRKVCNHPNLFEPRPSVSPFIMNHIEYPVPSCVWNMTEYNPFENVDLFSLNLLISRLEFCLTAFASHRIRRFQASKKLIEEIDSAPSQPPRCPAGKIKLHVRLSSQSTPKTAASSISHPNMQPNNIINSGMRVSSQLQSSLPHANSTQSGGIRYHVIQQGNSVKAIPLSVGGSGSVVLQQTPQGPRLVMPPRPTSTGASPSPNPSNNSIGNLQLVQTPSGQLLLTTAQVQKPSVPTSLGFSGTAAIDLLRRIGLKGLQGSVITTGVGGRPVLRLPNSALRPHLQGPVSSSGGENSNSLALSKPPVVPQLTQSAVPQASPTKPVQAAPAPPPPQASGPSPVQMNSVATKPTTRTETKLVEKLAEKKLAEERTKSLFFLADVEEKKKFSRKRKLAFLSNLNSRRCHARPIYGSDLIDTVSVMYSLGSVSCVKENSASFKCGLYNCVVSANPDPVHFWSQTSVLKDLIHSPESCLLSLRGITERFVFCVPSVVASVLNVRVHHPNPSLQWNEEQMKVVLTRFLTPRAEFLHPICSASATQFPHPRLIQYDCGKLQALDRLLRDLKKNNHRVLIFTQMTRMLDVFESFLNYHGHIYLRLDGTTKVDQRQALMERFNQDTRIFVFILSTRSGGIGVNLTGADTVIFYDSDWNPTMDAQAQDRCHRIGQTRDVHIYRLISEKTIEENILKKANQKRLLGDLAIEGGNFTTAHLKKQTIHELFNVDTNENDSSKRLAELTNKSKLEAEPGPEIDCTKLGEFESALAAAEDETDVCAAKTAQAEAAAELAEFDENIPLDDIEGGMSKAEQEVATLMKQLTPIEKYAMTYLESLEDGLLAEAEKVAAEIEQQKRAWEMGHLQAMQEEEERRTMDLEEDVLTCTLGQNQILMDCNSKEEMPIWLPPTPPHEDDGCFYTDHATNFLYAQTIIPESVLPPIYVKKENKRLKLEACHSISSEPSIDIRKGSKVKRDDAVCAPRSLFDRPVPPVAKLRRDLKLQKCKGPPQASSYYIPGLKHPLMPPKPGLESDNFPEWQIHEDWIVVNSLQSILQLPNSLTVYTPGHTPNWDLVSDLVNSYSSCYRSQRLCRLRYETVLHSREGKLGAEAPKRIFKKNKTGLPSRSMKTALLYQQDNNDNFCMSMVSKYEKIKSITIAKVPSSKSMCVTSSTKSSKHTEGLANDIQYDLPLTPAQVIAVLEKNKQQKQQEQHQSQPQASKQMVSQQAQKAIVQSQQQQHVNIVASSVGLQQVVNATKLPSSVVLNQTTIPVISTGLVSITTTSTTTTSATVAMLRTAVTVAGSSRLINVTGLQALQNQKITPTHTSQAIQQKNVAVAPISNQRALIPQKVQIFRQSKMIQRDPTIKQVQFSTPGGTPSKLHIAVSGPGMSTVQASQAGRAQIVKPAAVVPSSSATGVVVGTTNKALTQQLAKSGQVAQILANKGSLVNVKNAVGLQFSAKAVATGGLSTVQLVPSGAQKQVTVQQLQHVFKQGGAVMGKALPSSSTSTPVALVTSGGSPGTIQAIAGSGGSKLLPFSLPSQQPIKQTIQVVSAGSQIVTTTSAMRVTTAERVGAPALSLPAGAVKVTNPTNLLSIGAQRTQTPSPVRIQAIAQAPQSSGGGGGAGATVGGTGASNSAGGAGGN